MKPLKKPSEVWKTFEVFLGLLRTKGFEIEISSGAVDKLSKGVHWEGLLVPAPSDFKGATACHYAFVQGDGARSFAADANWGLVFWDKNMKVGPPAHLPVVLCPRADAAVDLMLRHLEKEEWTASSEEDLFSQNPKRFPKVKIENAVVVGPESTIGEGTVVESFVRIGARVRIGKNCRIGSMSRIADDTVIGDNCVFTASVSLGGPGFGFTTYPKENVRKQRAHVGQVIIGNNVRLGAFVGIDRGVMSDTIVGDFASIDNIVQVGHNCSVGEESVLCAFVALAGSTHLGKKVTFAGLSGTKGHLSIGDGAVIAAQTGVTKDIDAGQSVKGWPARPLNEALQIQVLMGRLPELFKKLKDMGSK